MATRMQQRKGTAQQWLSTNSGNGPVLNPGEIGFEVDTNKFKIGDGVSHWVDLNYFADEVALGGSIDDYIPLTQKGQNNGVAQLDNTGKIPSTQIPALVGLDTEIETAVNNAVNALVDGAPAALNTLNELAAAVNDDASFASTITAAIAAQIDSNELDSAIGTAVSNLVNGAPAGLNTLNEIATAIGNDPAFSATVAAHLEGHRTDTTEVHGITNTVDLATKNYADTSVSNAVTGLTKSSVGLANVDNTSDANKPVSTATQTSLNLKADIESPTFTGNVSGITKSMVGLANVDNTSDVSKPVSTAAQTALDLKAPLANPTFTGTVSGITKTMVGLSSVDDTSDTAKPVSTAQASAIATAKSEAIADATSQVNAVIASAPAALNTLDELAAALGDDASFATTITNALAAKAPLADPTFTGTVSGVTKTHVGLGSVDNTSDANKPVSTATQTALNLKANLDAPTFTGIVTIPADGIITSPQLTLSTTTSTVNGRIAWIQATDKLVVGDGVLAIEFAPSTLLTNAQTASYTVVLSDKDKVIEMNVSSANNLTVPTNASVAYPVGSVINIIQTNTGQTTVVAAGGVTINGTPGLKLRAQFSGAVLIKRAENTWILLGDLTA